MLRVIEGGRDQPLRLDDLPLGTWAGATVEVWATKTGSRWHADPACSTLTNRARSESWQQPESGTLGGRRLPTGLHCTPPGELGGYLAAAQWLVGFVAETRQGEDQVAAGDLPLDVLPGRSGWRVDARWRHLLEAGALGDVWSPALDERRQLVAAMRAHLAPAGERMAVMSMANWVRRGRTPREHQAHYHRFVEVAAQVFDAHELDVQGAGGYINQDSLPDWLKLIAAGGSVTAATQRVVDRECERAHRQASGDPDLPEQIRRLWQAIGARWQDVLAGMALAHTGAVLAVFHMYGTSLKHDLMDVCLTYGPAAQLTAGHLDWIAATVPASFRCHLTEGERGLGGLVLLDEHADEINSNGCALFLRNLVTELGHPELGQHVSPRGDGELDLVDNTREPFIDVALPDHLHGFASPGFRLGITVADCVAPLRAAIRGETLTRTRSPRRR